MIYARKNYVAKWNSQLNKDHFRENGTISFSVEARFFSLVEDGFRMDVFLLRLYTRITKMELFHSCNQLIDEEYLGLMFLF